MPDDVIVAARDLHGADRRIGTEFSGHHSGAAVVQFRTGVGAGVVEIVESSCRPGRAWVVPSIWIVTGDGGGDGPMVPSPC